MTDETDPLREVRDRIASAEEVDMGDVPIAADTPDPLSENNVPPADGDEPTEDHANAELLDRLRRAAEQPLNDYGNGQRMIIHHGEDLMYVPRVSWFTWVGTHWAKDQDKLGVRTRAQGIWRLIEQETQFIEPTKREKALIAEEKRLRRRESELASLEEGERAEGHAEEVGTIIARLKSIEATLKDHKSLIGRRLGHARVAGNSASLGHMIDESETDLAVPFEALDTNPYEVNTLSGALRFAVDDGGGRNSASVEVLPHRREQRLTKLVPVEYVPGARSELWESFLERIQPDREMRAFLARWLGLSMLGLKVQNLAFFYGSGANGKGVLVDTVARVLNSYAATMKIESITGTNRRGGADATPDLVPLLGARFVRTSEPDQGVPLQEGMIKHMTGGEALPVRPNYGEQIEVEINFKVTMSGNHKPGIQGIDDGIWRRMLLVPFDVQIPLEERDDKLVEKLWAERVGIFAWLVEGACAYLEQGLAPPSMVRDATDEYREESDPLGSFLMSSCEITGDDSDTILSRDLADAFNYHLLERGLNTKQPTTVTRQLAVKSKQWKHPATGKRFTKGKASLSQYHGIRLVSDFAARWRAAPRDSKGQPIGVGRDDSAANAGASANYQPEDYA